MKIKYMLTVAAIVAVTKSSFAQYSADALKFSQFQTGSTARIKAIGNAGTAIGGDLSNISGNPAGLGFFTHSELSITPEFNDLQAKSTYYAGSATNNAASSDNLNFNNASIVFYAKVNKPSGSDKTKGLLSINFGLSYNRTSDFYGNQTYGGTNANSSIVNYFKQLADGDPYTVDDNTLQNWAYNHYLIDSVGYNSTAKSAIYRSNVNAPTSQLSNSVSTGGQTAFNFSMGANYSNKLYLGVGFGITNLRYNTTNTFTETGYQFVDKFNYNTQFQQTNISKGTGFNITLGAIYKPVEEFRIGASLTTPTWYTVDDDYSESLATRYIGSSTTYPTLSADYPLSYSLRTPLKVSGGASFFFGKYGFITGDIDYLDYSSINLGTSSTTSDGESNNGNYNPAQDNHDVATLYQSTVNVHVGGEARIADGVALRAGYGVQGSPFVNKAFQNNITTISGGIGYRATTYYIDATYANVTGSSTTYPYVLSNSSNIANSYASINKTYNNVFITLGLRF